MAVPRITSLAWIVPVLLSGCMAAPGMALFPDNHHLLHSTRKLIQSVPADIPRELAKQPLPPYTVEPGDVLLIQPADLDSPVRLPSEQPILPDGTIYLGRFGSLPVFGRTIPEIEALVRSAVEAQVKEVGPINVRLITRQSKVYYVLGDVQSPGAFPLIGRETVLDGLIAAGGLKDRANQSKIILSRPTAPDCARIVLPVCYSAIVQHGDTATNYQLQPGDRIYVPSRCFLDSMTAGGKSDPCKCGN